MGTKSILKSLWDVYIIKAALWDSLLKLVPQKQIRNPVMFSVYIGAILTTILFVQALFGERTESIGFILAITFSLMPGYK